MSASNASEPNSSGIGVLLAEDLFPELRRTLDEALVRSPRMVVQDLSLLQAMESTRVQASRLYPRAGASAQYNLAREETASRRDPVDTVKTYYNVQISQPVFHWGALHAGADIGRIQEELTRNNVAEAFRLLALEIRREFLALVSTKASLAHARLELEQARKRLDVAETRVRMGEIPAGLTEPARHAVVEAEFNIDRGEYTLDQALSRFARLTGRSGFTADEVPEEIPRLNTSGGTGVESLRREFVERGGIERTARMLNAELEARREGLNLRILRTNLRPKFDLVAGINQDERSYTLDVSRTDRIASLFIGMRVQWNIFDSASTTHQVRATRYRLRQLEAQARHAKEEHAAAIESVARELEFSGRSLEFAERSYGFALSAVSATESNVTRGLLSAADVDAAESRERASRISVFNARAAYLNAAAAFLSAIDADPVAQAGARQIRDR
ncbi:TolC family protein [Congregicoccus parvus]|uniref:TolC family protein n=1 Tax=Congregicoccus parvus TaxID=3081749 RepID=UPI003FA5D787